MQTDIVPMLTYENALAAMDWLCRVFGFTEKTKWLDSEGKLSHGEITVGSGIIMLANGGGDYQSPKHHRENCIQAAKWYSVPYIINGVLVYVDDVQRHFENARKLGAAILSELEYGEPGTRYRTEDPEGQRWMFMQKNRL
jgi:uncharacterized glyoxalase superfamily protein PhnB